VTIPLAFLPKVRSPGIMQAMHQMPCSLRIGTFIGLPCWHQDTNVGCHLPVMGKGVGTKVSDLSVACGCGLCHSLLDARDPRGALIREKYPLAFGIRLLDALAETQARLVAIGIILVPDAEIV